MGRPLAASSATQWRGLASGAGKGKGKDGGGGDEEGLFDRLKKTFAAEIEKVQQQYTSAPLHFESVNHAPAAACGALVMCA